MLLGHEGNKSFDVFDVAIQKAPEVIPTPARTYARTALAPLTPKLAVVIYVSGNDPSRMVIVDSTNLKSPAKSPPREHRSHRLQSQTGLVYECNDTAGEVWVIDPAAKKIVTTIKLDGSGVEDLAFDPEYKHLYQAVKGKNTIAVIDPASNKVTDAWPLAPDKGAHGIAVVPDSNGLLVACASKLVLLDRSTGKVTATVPTGARVDEMTYDPGLHIAYCASRQGNISVVSVEADKLKSLGDVPDETGTGDITVDPKTHTVWIAFKKGGECFIAACSLQPIVQIRIRVIYKCPITEHD